MGIERMVCCGALTRVYSDAGRRAHSPDCKFIAQRERERRALAELMELEDDEES